MTPITWSFCVEGSMNNLSSKFNLEKLSEISDYKRALIIVDVMFKDVKDKSGEPYINHLLTVSNNLDTPSEKIVGLLHDLVEDTDTTFEELKEVRFNDTIIEALKLVTKKEGESYPDFIDRIINSNNIIALKVKIKDMENNMDPNRLDKLPDDLKEKLQNKYEPEYKKLIKKRGEYYDRY